MSHASKTDQVPAFSGVYPLFGGWGNWELFTRRRLLTCAEEVMQEWVALSGPTRGRLLRVDKLPHIEVEEGRRYDRVRIAGRTFWVHRRHRKTIRAWAAPRRTEADERADSAMVGRRSDSGMVGRIGVQAGTLAHRSSGESNCYRRQLARDEV